MPLGSPNNPNTDHVILGVLKSLILNDPHSGQPNTILGQNQVSLNTSLIYIESKYAMSQGPFPALHLSSGHQDYHYAGGPRTYGGVLEAIIEYCDRWDLQASTIDQIRANIASDLERMKANIETNDSLAYQGQNYAISIPRITLSPYMGEFDTQFPGLTLVCRTMSLTINILPYDAA
jgi:hypothetical protein